LSKSKKTRIDQAPPAPATRPRVLLAMAAVALLALVGALNFYQFLTAYAAQPATSQTARLADRFSEVSTVVPPGARLAYLSDIPVDKDSGALHSTAQYAIAPRLLDTTPDTPRQWILGDFYQPYDAARTAQERGLEVVRDFGNGVVIFRRSGR
jgi:hypothetical protein